MILGDKDESPEVEAFQTIWKVFLRVIYPQITKTRRRTSYSIWKHRIKITKEKKIIITEWTWSLLES